MLRFRIKAFLELIVRRTGRKLSTAACAVAAVVALVATARGDDVLPRLAFDIPVQPLDTALNAYGAATQVAIFYDGSLAAGRKSTAVHGSFTPQQALRKLLEGTDLVGAPSGAGTVTIDQVVAPQADEVAAIKRRTATFVPYLGTIQSRLNEALCRSTPIRQDENDVLVRFWIAASGAVERVMLLTSTGSPERDSLYANALQSLEIGKVPPGLPQPITMLILARQSDHSAKCISARQSAVH
ncbi:secretin and TonB N-terminal domain-containing protein [Microbacteriaceae bacterium K1510]|nr:secretin and TonB N-terminal domain-containing protein [Microbacteriaceae bacterium K1510]